MLKKGFFYFGLVGIVAFMSSGFKNGKLSGWQYFLQFFPFDVRVQQHVYVI